MRVRDFENFGHGVVHRSPLGVQGFPEKRSFMSELTHALGLVDSSRRGSQISRVAHGWGSNGKSFLFEYHCSQQRSYLKFSSAKRVEWNLV